MGGKPRASPRRASLFAAAIERQGRHDLGHADTIVAPAASLSSPETPRAPAPAKPPPVPPRKPSWLSRATSAVTRTIARRPAPDHSADATTELSATDLRSLTISEEDE